MKSWPFAVFGVACLAMFGCRAAPRAVTLLEQENRNLEMQIYELAAMVEDARKENARLRERLEDAEDERGPSAPDRAPASPEPIFPPEVPEPESPDLPDDVPTPEIEMPSASLSADEFLQKFSREPASSPSDSLPPPPEEEARDRMSAPRAEIGDPVGRLTAGDPVACEADNAQVAEITLDDRLTGGLDLDRRAGHEGVITVIEPRNADGRLVPAAAPVSVVVLDPAMPGDDARVARWDLSAEEIAERYRKTPLSEGVHLELEWPRAVPIHSRLHMFVRYLTDDGRKLEDDTSIEVEVPTLEAQRSMPPTATPTARSNREPAPSAEWQSRPSPSAEPAPEEAPQTARLPRPAASAPAPASRSRPRSESSSRSNLREAPLWSPDRP